MTKKILLGVLAAALVVPLQAARAQSDSSTGGTGATMGPQQPMPGMMANQKNLQNVMTQAQAIAPLFSNPVAWRGDVPAGAMGQNAPAATTQGTANCTPILQGWYTCDISDRYLMSSAGTGTGGTGSSQMGTQGQTGQMGNQTVMNWSGHMVVGYDANANAYKAMMVDNQGTGMVNMDGTLNGKKFTLTTSNPVMMMGQAQKQRLSFDFTDPNNIQFTDERQSTGQQGWTVFEKAIIKPYTSAVSRQASTPSRR